MTELPTYRDLPIREGLPPHSSWGVFGERDDVGAMNLLTPERVLAASRLVRRGAVFPLNGDLETPDPPILGRKPMVHTVIDSASGPDDRYDNYFPQASTQWDALTHVRHPEYGYYNGLDRESFGIEKWAQRGLAGRFVLADVARYFAHDGRPIDGSACVPVSRADVEATLRFQGTDLTPGTFLLLNFGWLEWYLAADAATKARLAEGADFTTAEHDLERFFPAPGLARDEEMAAWLWDSGVVAAAADCPALESMPMHRGSVEGFLHYRLVALLGIGIGELWDLRALAADCADDGVYEGLLTSAPLNKKGGTGSPANALAIK